MIVPIGVAVLLLAAAGIFGIRFEAVRSHFDPRPRPWMR